MLTQNDLFFEWREWESRWMGEWGAENGLTTVWTCCLQLVELDTHFMPSEENSSKTNVVVTHLLIGVQALDNISEALVPSCTMPQIPGPLLTAWQSDSSEAVMHSSTPPAFIKLHLLRRITKGQYLKEHQWAKDRKWGWPKNNSSLTL